MLIHFFCTFANCMKKQSKITHKEAARRALEELGGRARLRDIYPRVIPFIKYKPGSDIKATLRRLLQTTPELFRRVDGMKGWYELVSYQRELAERDKRIVELKASQIKKEDIIKAFDGFDTMIEKLFAKYLMQSIFRGNAVWESAYKEMKRDGYFKEPISQIVLNNPQFGSLYEIKGNQEVKIEK